MPGAWEKTRALPSHFIHIFSSNPHNDPLLTLFYSWGDWSYVICPISRIYKWQRKDSNPVGLILETMSLPHALGLGRTLHAKASPEVSGLCGNLSRYTHGKDTVWKTHPWKESVAWRLGEICSPSLWIIACVAFQCCVSKASWPRDRQQEAIPVFGPDLESSKTFYLITLPLAFNSAALLTEILDLK